MKTKFPHADALAVAQELQSILAPACRRIAIAGSLRRLKPEVSGIELLFVPILSERPDGLFDVKIVDVCDEVVQNLLATGVIKQRPNVHGHTTWGERNKLAIHVPSGIPVDLFGTSEQNWWVSLVVRTGSEETNLRLTTGANKQGASLMAYGIGVKWRSGVKWSDGNVTPAISEQHVFAMCGVPYLEPSKR